MPPVPTSDRHIVASRRRLGHLAGLGARTEGAERGILKAAEQRLAAIRAELARLSDRVLTDHSAADRYVDLTQERGQVEMVIARARQALAL
jgi:uncharacterized protein involved in exopolysaccharide biosynthesis